MDKLIKNILTKIEANGFEAFVVGGYVRDYLLGIKSSDVDICTNALPKDLHQIFPQNSNSNSYGGFNLKIKNYNIDITTYRKELKYESRKPTEVIYLNKLEEDIIRRDFTINSVCLDKNDKIIDLVDGVSDINSHVIRMLGNIKVRLEEDPLRILRAVRFASILNFTIDEMLYKELKNNYELINTLSKDRIKQELNKILLNKNFKKGLEILKDLKILDLLGISYSDITYVNDLCGMWAQLSYHDSLTFTKQENANIISIREILNRNTIGNKELYEYGLYNSLVASEVLNIPKKTVNKMYANLKLKSAKDLNITNEEIINILKIQPSSLLKDIKNDMIEKILDNTLKNNNSELRKYVEKWRK